MATHTFGYDAVQDRIWMRSHDHHCTVWLTRRLVNNLLGPVIKAFVEATPGGEGGAPAPQRAAIEHDLALNEAPPGGQPARLTAGHVGPGDDADPQQRLCRRVTTRTGSQQVVLQFETDAGPLELRLGRRGMHLWLRGLCMTLKSARWDLPQTLPDWLSAGLMPPALQKIIQPAPGSDPPSATRTPPGDN